MSVLIYIPLQKAISIHAEIIQKTGGLELANPPATIDKLDSILTHIQNDDYYPFFSDKVTFLFYSIVKNHVFLDGNKRSAIAICSYFLNLNGYDHIVSRFINEMESAVIWLAENKIEKDILNNYIIYILQDLELSDAFKLNLISRINQK